MQKILKYSSLVLALALILVLESPVQGYPMRRARYQWVRCNPDSNSANCIDERGPLFNLPPGESNRILPAKTDSFSLRRFQNLNDVFPLSEDYSGSGFGSGSGSGSGAGSGSGNGFLNEMEQEYQPVAENDAVYDNFRSFKSSLPSDSHSLAQDGLEEDFII